MGLIVSEPSVKKKCTGTKIFLTFSENRYSVYVRGGTMQSLLGHSTPETMREVYLHAIPEEQRRAAESVERLVFGPKLDTNSASNAKNSQPVH